jgi:predicted aspartyl protease
MHTGFPIWCLQTVLLTSLAGPVGVQPVASSLPSSLALPHSLALPAPLTNAAPLSSPSSPNSSSPNSPSPVSPSPEDPTADDVLFASPTRLDHIGRIVAPVMIDGQGPFRFIVDSGANYSTITPQLAGKLGLQSAAGTSMLVNGITGTAQVPSVPIASLQAGDLRIENSQFPVVWAPLMAGADGILGVAGLKNERLFVDFERNRVQIARSNHVAALTDFTRLAAKRIRGGLMSVAAQVGGVHVLAIIDTGSERTIANKALRDALYARRSRAAALKTTDVYGATTDVASGEVDFTAPVLDLGPIHIGRATLVFGDFHIFEVWGLTQHPAMIVGMDILGTLSALGIDFRQAQIYIDSRYHFQSAAAAGSVTRP